MTRDPERLVVKEIQIEIIDNPGEALCEAVNVHLRTHNQSANPIFWQKITSDTHQQLALNILAFDDDRQVLGGLFGTTQLSWLKIDIMAVKEDRRSQGIGQSLLACAEQTAKHRGCKYSYVNTMEYQAPGFYQKYGYTIAGRISDWDSHGHEKTFFVKELR